MPTVGDVSKNLDWTIEEARRQIDKQMDSSGEIDSRANTFLGLLGGITGITAIFGDIRLDSPERVAATAVTAIFAILAAILFAFTLSPRQGASYGPELQHTLDAAQEEDALVFRLAVAAALRQAREDNKAFLEHRQLLLRTGIVCFAVAIVFVMFMILTQAVIPAPSAPTL